MSSLPPGSVTETCYVTTDLARAVHQWGEAFKAGPFFTLTIPAAFGSRIYRGRPAEDSFSAALGFCGASVIEFEQPLDDEASVFREVFQERGDLAVHHVYPTIRRVMGSEFDERCARYERAGFAAALV